MSAARRVELLTAVGEALYGEHWHLPLSRRYGFDVRNLRRWLRGTREMSPHHLEKLATQVSGDVQRLYLLSVELGYLVRHEPTLRSDIDA